MKSILSFLNSGLFSNILAIISIVIAFIPQKDTITIDQSKHYYFNPSTAKKTSGYGAIILGISVLLCTFILYTFFHSYYLPLILILALALIFRYRRLRIANKQQVAFPILLVIMSTILNNFSPKIVQNYWENTTQFNWNQIDGAQKIQNQLTEPIIEFLEIFRKVFTNDPLSIAIFANILFILFSTYFLLHDLFISEKYIRIIIPKQLLGITILFLIILSFVFYTEPSSPSRIVVDTIAKFQPN